MDIKEDRVKISYFEDDDNFFKCFYLNLEQYCNKFNEERGRNIYLDIEQVGFEELKMGLEHCLGHVWNKSDLDLILIDQFYNYLPFKGFDIIKRIKDAKIDIPIIMLSEQNANNEGIILNSEARKAGAKAFFRKAPLLYGDNKEEFQSVFFRDLLQKANAYRDKEELRRKNHELMELSITDPLTGLSNRRRFESKLEESLYHRENWRVCVAFLDINGFKEINDNYGHGVGDDYLREISSRLKSQVKRHEDLVARIGGDEFGMILLNPKSEYVEQMLSDVYENLTFEYKLPNGINLKNPGVSIGASIFDVEQKPFDVKKIRNTLMREADISMYAHKKRKEPEAMNHRYVLFDLKKRQIR